MCSTTNFYPPISTKSLENKECADWLGRSFYCIVIKVTKLSISFRIPSNRSNFNNWENIFLCNLWKTGVPGCIEHTFTFIEALKEANAHTRQIVITWIDLANAYGSVRHNLIQFALNWFHVPLPIQELIFNYYEKLCAMVKTKKWSNFFLISWNLQKCSATISKQLKIPLPLKPKHMQMTLLSYHTMSRITKSSVISLTHGCAGQ